MAPNQISTPYIPQEDYVVAYESYKQLVSLLSLLGIDTRTARSFPDGVGEIINSKGVLSLTAFDIVCKEMEADGNMGQLSFDDFKPMFDDMFHMHLKEVGEMLTDYYCVRSSCEKAIREMVENNHKLAESFLNENQTKIIKAFEQNKYVFAEVEDALDCLNSNDPIPLTKEFSLTWSESSLLDKLKFLYSVMEDLDWAQECIRTIERFANESDKMVKVLFHLTTYSFLDFSDAKSILPYDIDPELSFTFLKRVIGEHSSSKYEKLFSLYRTHIKEVERYFKENSACSDLS